MKSIPAVDDRADPRRVGEPLLADGLLGFGPQQPSGCNEPRERDAAVPQGFVPPAEQSRRLLAGEIVELPLTRRVGAGDHLGSHTLFLFGGAQMIIAMQHRLMPPRHRYLKHLHKLRIGIDPSLVMMVGDDQKRGDRHTHPLQILQHPHDHLPGHRGEVMDRDH